VTIKALVLGSLDALRRPGSFIDQQQRPAARGRFNGCSDAVPLRKEKLPSDAVVARPGEGGDVFGSLKQKQHVGNLSSRAQGEARRQHRLPLTDGRCGELEKPTAQAARILAPGSGNRWPTGRWSDRLTEEIAPPGLGSRRSKTRPLFWSRVGAEGGAGGFVSLRTFSRSGTSSPTL